MNGADVIAAIIKREGTEFLACYPRNPLIEACAAIDIRPILCRQERVGVGMADGFSRIRRGRQNGVTPDMLGIATSRKEILKTIGLALCVFGAFYLLLFASSTAFHVDFRFFFVSAAASFPSEMASFPGDECGTER